MAPNPEPLRSRGAKHSVHDQYWRAGQQSQVTRGDYLCVLSPKRKLILHKKENGPGGIRTRICDLDRVLCSRYTTGPERSFGVGTALGKVMRHNFVGWVPKLGGNQVPWAALRAGSRLCHSTGAIPTSRKSARCGAPGRCCHNSAHLESSLRRAGALQHPKVCAPRTHGLPVLVGHNP